MWNIETLKAYIGSEHTTEIQALMENCEQSKLSNLVFKNPKVAVILSVFFGLIGIDRLYQGGIKMFLYKLAMNIMTFGTWWLVDIYYNKHSVEEANYQKLLSTTA